MKYKVMRMICMFDLPVETSEEQRIYRTFRKNLIKEGFIMMQYSVYIRTCPNRGYCTRLENRMQKFMPEKGNVRIIVITEKQYENMKFLVGKPEAKSKKIDCNQLSLF